jgi:hypothetical protein
MPHLQVKDCPEDIYKKITSGAKRQNRTISEQAIVILEKGLCQEEINPEPVRELLEEII